jgi:hypothetical protein
MSRAQLLGWLEEAETLEAERRAAALYDLAVAAQGTAKAIEQHANALQGTSAPKQASKPRRRTH